MALIASAGEVNSCANYILTFTPAIQTPNNANPWYHDGLTRFYYTVYVTNSDKDISHFDITLPICAQDKIEGKSWHNTYYQIGDPTTGITGIKFDNDPRSSNNLYWFDLEGDWRNTLGSATAAIKAGTSVCRKMVQAPASCGIPPCIMIITLPSSQTVCIGDSAIFNVVAAGFGLTYRWQLSRDGGSSWIDLSDHAGASLTVSGATASMDGYQYRVVVTGSCGSATLDAVTLRVYSPPTITSQPQSVTICEGETATFSITASASSGDLIYQWYMGTTALSDSTHVTGSDTNTLSICGVTSDDTGPYKVVVSGTAACSKSSNTVALVVQEKPTVDAGPDQHICGFKDASLVGTATNYASVSWGIESGLGSVTLDPNDPMKATFHPGIDLPGTYRTVVTFTATPLSPCSNSVTDETTIQVVIMPHVSIEVIEPR